MKRNATSKPRRKRAARSSPPSLGTVTASPPAPREPPGFEEHDDVANEPLETPAPLNDGSHDFGVVDPSSPHVIAPRIS